MPYNSYRFSCEHVLLKRLSFLSKLSIILNCHSKKGYFLSMGEGVLSQTAAGWAGYTPAHTEACTCKQTHTWIHVHVHSAHTLLSQCSHPPPATGATPAQLVAAAVGQWGWSLPQPRHRAGHTGRARKVSAKLELSENYHGGREKAKPLFPPQSG